MSIEFKDRLVYQYRYAERFKQLLAIKRQRKVELREMFNRLLTRLDIDESSGAQLDGIGEIINAPRPAIAQGEDDAFAFSGPTSGLGFDEGKFVSLFTNFEDATPVNDVEYRRVLRAAIISNRASGTRPDIIQFFVQALGLEPQVSITTGLVTVTIERALLQFEQRIVDSLAPLAAGVTLEIAVNG